MYMYIKGTHKRQLHIMLGMLQYTSALLLYDTKSEVSKLFLFVEVH